MGVLTPCNEWSAGTSNGYGWIGGYVRQYAHRWTWEQAHGPIPDGLEVMHLCDNPPCVNLDHLALGTHAANMAQMKARGRANGGSPWKDTPTCKNGHDWTEENIYRPPKRPNERACRACRREAVRRHQRQRG